VALAVLAALAVAVAMVARDRGSGEESALPAPEDLPAEPTSFLARLIPRSEAVRAARVARRLPVERKVGQLFLVGFSGQGPDPSVFRLLRRVDLGGIVIVQGNYAGPGPLGQLARRTAVTARRAKHLRPWVLAPQEGGEENAFPGLPPADVPADLPSARAAAAQARAAARSLRSVGVSGVLAPVVDVGLEQDPALGARVYSDDPQEVAAFAAGTVTAYSRARVFSAVKHFPGLGSASQATDQGPATVGLSPEELRQRDLAPFRAAFRARVPGVVLSHALYSLDDFTSPGSLSRTIATELLRDRLGFRGVAITDDLADPAITALFSVPQAAVRAVEAGADMIFISGPASDQRRAYATVLRAVRRGQISRRRLDEAVIRIIAAKRRFGLVR
jgi:beta-N-acetylhexosaminidase